MKRKSSEEKDSSKQKESYESENEDSSVYSSESSSDEDDDGKLNLDGTTIKKYVDDDDDDDIDSESSEDDDEEKTSPPARKKSKTSKENNEKKKKKTKKKKGKDKEDDEIGNGKIVNVEFTFHDMNEKFFHGMKILLNSAHPIHAPYSSNLSDYMIENIRIGTVVSSEGMGTQNQSKKKGSSGKGKEEEEDDNDSPVFGFASVVPTLLKSTESSPVSGSIKQMKEICLKHCPKQHSKDLKNIFSKEKSHPVGFFVHGRMINLPLEIALVLQEQLILDMDWVQTKDKESDIDDEERKVLNFEHIILMAPGCIEDSNSDEILYKYFDDEIFASHGKFSYSFDIPNIYGTEEKHVCSIIVMTKKGHRNAMKEFKRMVSGV